MWELKVKVEIEVKEVEIKGGHIGGDVEIDRFGDGGAEGGRRS